MKFALCLGGNIGDVRSRFDGVEKALAAFGVKEIRRSTVYVTAPVGCVPGTPDFQNQALTGECNAAPEELFALLQRPERQYGRPALHSSQESRTLDCDVILWGEECICSDILTVPHPRARMRQFVLEPLAEIAPEMKFPDGMTVAQAWAALQKDLA
ncbi:MAG: 2-amino-4-hydroxy-6-hydroxymethyldihydropteridine diphosphokinase [Lentisphaeria bacterium]|nr:2-amino-4-hydroxy-6-hydroxymethyldihydropteridine diphosphokinase [Lentisphaeria bacterium]